jgi:hypothetical protein
MAKTVKRLKDMQIRRLSKPGSYPDGEGLYLQVRTSGAKDWFYRYEVDGKGRKRGLGSYPTISLEQARDDASNAANSDNRVSIPLTTLRPRGRRKLSMKPKVLPSRNAPSPTSIHISKAGRTESMNPNGEIPSIPMPIRQSEILAFKISTSAWSWMY